MNSLNSNPWRLLMVVVVIGFGYPVYEFLTLLCKCNVVKSFVLLLMEDNVSIFLNLILPGERTLYVVFYVATVACQRITKMSRKSALC